MFPATDFTEGLAFGYRWYDQQGKEPLVPFGHGLSYTTFQYSDLAVSSVTPAPNASARVRVSITNAGAVAGAEIVQLYLAYPQQAGEPPQLLRGFSKTSVLPPGASELACMGLSARSISVCHVHAG